jgi:hypothetical protein
MSGFGADGKIEQFTGSEHGMHDHGELARDRDGGSFEADLLLELEASDAQSAIDRGPRQDHDCRFIQ